jgi:hypothetical protein
VEHLYIHEGGYISPRWQNDIENSQWLECFHLFTAAKNLYLSKEFSPPIAPALQELFGERTAEVLRTLQSLSLEVQPSGSVQETIGESFATRQLTGYCSFLGKIIVKHVVGVSGYLFFSAFDRINVRCHLLIPPTPLFFYPLTLDQLDF